MHLVYKHAVLLFIVKLYDRVGRLSLAKNNGRVGKPSGGSRL
jgi:hypothetical protein